MDNQQITDQFILDLRRDIDAMRVELKELREYVFDFEKDHRALTQDTTKRICLFNNAISVIEDSLAPIEETIFPGEGLFR